MSLEQPSAPEQGSEARLAEIEQLLAEYHRDVADHHEGVRTLTQEDLDNAEREIERLEKEKSGLNEVI